MVTDSAALVAIVRLLDLGRHVLRLRAGVAALFFLASAIALPTAGQRLQIEVGEFQFLLFMPKFTDRGQLLGCRSGIPHMAKLDTPRFGPGATR